MVHPAFFQTYQLFGITGSFLSSPLVFLHFQGGIKVCKKLTIYNRYNCSMASITQTVANNSKYNSTQNNQRGATIVRTCGEEHLGIKHVGTNIFYLPHDNDMCYISEFKIKFIFGTGGADLDPNLASPSPNPPVGSRIFSSVDDFMAKAGPGTAWDTLTGNQGAQCVDYANLFWETMTGRSISCGGNNAKGIWLNARAYNAGTEFELIYNWEDIQKGDWLIWSRGVTGHVAMAIEAPNGDTVKCYGQNIPSLAQPFPGGGTEVCEYTETRATFGGAFRYKW